MEAFSAQKQLPTQPHEGNVEDWYVEGKFAMRWWWQWCWCKSMFCELEAWELFSLLRGHVPATNVTCSVQHHLDQHFSRFRFLDVLDIFLSSQRRGHPFHSFFINNAQQWLKGLPPLRPPIPLGSSLCLLRSSARCWPVTSLGGSFLAH